MCKKYGHVELNERSQLVVFETGSNFQYRFKSTELKA